MKKWLIGSLVGAILLFLWQFFSWGISSIHSANYGHTPNEQAILANLSSNLTEDGQYMLPAPNMNATHEEAEKAMKANEGKPWAVIQYHPQYKIDMVMPMVRGFIIDLVIVLLLIYIFGNYAAASFGGIFISTLAVGLISWLYYPYTGHNWMQTPMATVKADLIDIAAGWGLLGLWLGFWLKRS